MKKYLWTAGLSTVLMLSACNQSDDSSNETEEDLQSEIEHLKEENADLQEQVDTLEDEADSESNDESNAESNAESDGDVPTNDDLPGQPINQQDDPDPEDMTDSELREAVAMGELDQFELMEQVDEAGMNEWVTVDGIQYRVTETEIDYDGTNLNSPDGVFYQLNVTVVNEHGGTEPFETMDYRYTLMDEDGEQYRPNYARTDTAVNYENDNYAVFDMELREGEEFDGPVYFDVPVQTAEDGTNQLYIGKITGDEYAVINLD